MYFEGACLYFAKDFPRLIRNKEECVWDRYNMRELKGATLGIVGYGDIGYSCAKLAKVMGMTVIALRRRPELNTADELVDKVNLYMIL
jgi:phosphoglycerate dehydrogenase-like enzyme